MSDPTQTIQNPSAPSPSPLGVKSRPSDQEIGQDLYVQVNMTDEDRERLSNYLVNEIDVAKRDRDTLTSNMAEWERLYEARPKVAQKTFPFEGAANIVVPVIATAVDSVLARLINSIFGAGELWNTRQRSAAWTDLVEPVNTFLNWAQKEVLKMYQVCQRWFLGCIKNGTGVLKLPWERRMRRVVYSGGSGGNSTGQSIEEGIVTMHDGPAPEAIPLADFFVSSDAIYSHDIQNCEWVAQRGKLTYKTLKEKELSGEYFEVNKILQNKRTQPLDDVEDEVQTNVGIEPSEYKDWEIWEVYVSYILEAPEPSEETDGTSTGAIPAELIVTIEPESGHILRAVYNFYRHQERPFHVIRWMPRENSFFGIGLAQMLQDIQEEITTIHNQRLDNATVANAKVFKKRRQATMGPLDIYPGALIEVDEMDDIDAMEMGAEHSTLLPEELHTNTIGEKRSGVNDYTAGRESSAIGSSATATSTLALIRESNKRFQMTIQDIRERLNDIGHQTLMLYQQFAPQSEVVYELFDDKEKAMVQQYMTLPMDYTKTHVYIDTPSLSEANNKEMAQQTLMTLLDVVEKYYVSAGNALMVTAMPEAPPAIKELAATGAIAATKIFERLLESFDFRDANSFVPDMNKLVQLSVVAGQLGGMNGQTTGGPANPNGGQAPPGPGGQEPGPNMGVPQQPANAGAGQGGNGNGGG